MGSKFSGLPLALNPKQASQLYEGIEYKDFWVEKEKAKLDGLEHALVRRLLPPAGKRIIDIGCGFGRLADCYLDRFEQVVMLDGSMTLLRQAQEALKDRAVYIAADANHLPFAKSSFDCALMIRVFHHMPDSHWILSEIKRILSAGGIFTFNYSNKLSASRLPRRLLRWNKENPFVLEPVVSGGTLIHHHPAYVQRMLVKTGFSEMGYLGMGVVDKVTGKLGRFENLMPSGEALAHLLGVIKLAPWIMCRTRVNGGDTLRNEKCIDDLLICPSCQSSLRRSEQAYVCISCDLSYPIEDNIADFRLGV
jgi:SAM-dependent methyltransferase